MPSLIFNEITLPKQEVTKQWTKRKNTKHASPKPLWAKAAEPYFKPNAERWLWSGVIIFSVLIIGLWGISFKERLAHFNFSSTPEAQLLTQGQTDWNTAFAQEEVATQNQTINSQIKNAVSQIVLTASGATNTAAGDETTSSPTAVGEATSEATTSPTGTTETSSPKNIAVTSSAPLYGPALP